ncbi:MAG: respiratory nitrate reductase subunit gamma [Rectinemataceae bacterium]
MEGDTPLAAVTAASQAVAQVAHTGFALVMDKIYYFIMVPMVYLAIAFFIAAIVVKIVKMIQAGAAPYQLAIYPLPKHPKLAALRDTFGMTQIRKKNPLFWFFLMMYHLGFLLLFLGHLDLFPQINFVDPASRHMLGAGAVGLMVTIPTFYFLGRRFRGADRAISTPGDYLFLLLLLFLFLLGDMISWGNSWTANGFVMTKQNFAQYFDGLARFTFADPRLVLHGSHYHFVVLHVLLAELLLIVLPFTKVVHTFFALPLNMVRRTIWTRK